MLISNRWQSRIALLVALGMTSTAGVPILVSTPAMAGKEPYVIGQFSQSSRVIVPAGITIPVRYDSAERIIITPKETAPVTLTVAKNIRSSSGKILIPVNSQVKGQLKPAAGGSQFFAQELIFSNSRERLPINAISEIITATQTINKRTNPNILKDAAIGAGAGALLGGILGGIRPGQVLAGAGIGGGIAALERGRKETKVVVIDPDTDLHLFLRADLVGDRQQKADFTPLPQTQCQGLQEAVAQRLGVEVTLTTSPLQDYVNQQSGTGCLLTATGTGQKFSSPAEVSQKVGAVLTQRGWGEEPAYVAGGPTGMSAGYSRSNNFGLLRVEWKPAPGVNCPSNQPIASCTITPEQRRYTITLSLARMKPD